MTDSLALAVTLRGDATALKKTMADAGVAVDKFTQESLTGAKARHTAVVRGERAIQNELGNTAKAHQRLVKSEDAVTQKGRDRALLGVRSERAIQQEIRNTEAAYQRLMRTGGLSLNEQARAAEATKKKVAELRRELHGEAPGGGVRALGTGRALMAGGAAIAAGAALMYPVMSQVKPNMDYDQRLAYMANTAFSGRDVAGRIAGKQELQGAIIGAIRDGKGGTRESVAETLDSLLASGALSQKEVMGVLPAINKAAVASGASPQELADIAIRAKQNFGIGTDRMGTLMGQAMTAGQAGGFELRDMARWLPQQMAAARMSGMTGEGGFIKLLAANQAAVITAGTKDEAGNNVVNLLAKINSNDTAHDAKKLGINLPKRLAADRAKGMDSLDSFIGIVDGVVGKNSKYKALQQQLSTAKSDDARRSIMESQADILQGSSIGKLVQDRQAMMALVAIMGNRDYMKDVATQVRSRGGSEIDNSLAVVTDSNASKVQRAEAENTYFGERLTKGLENALGNFSANWTKTMQDYWAKDAEREQRRQAREQERTKVEGTIKIQFDADGKPRVRSVNSNGVDISADTGYSVGAD